MDTPTDTPDRVAELHRQADDDYARAQAARAQEDHRDDADLHGYGRAA